MNAKQNTLINRTTLAKLTNLQPQQYMRTLYSLAFTLFFCHSYAATKTWSGAGSNALWSNISNWSGGLVPADGDDIVFFSTTANNVTQNDLPATNIYKSIRLTGIYGSSNNFTINGNTILLSGGASAILNDAGTAGSAGASYALTFGADLGFRTNAPTITLANTTNNAISFNGKVDNGGMTLTLNNTGNSTNVTFSGVISGSGGFTKTGTGNVMINGANTYTGTTTLIEGIIRLNNNQALGIGGAVVVQGGGFSAFSTNISLNPHPMTWSGNFGLSGSRDVNLGTGAVTMTQDISIDVVSGRTLTVGGVISGVYNLTKTGGGVLHLGGTNSYSGSTTISGGTIRLGSASALGAASACVASSGTVVAAGASLDLNGQTYTALEALVINTTATGALINSSATTARFDGCLSLGSDSYINASVGTITLNNTTTAITGAYNLTLMGVGGTVNNTIATATGGLIKEGTGTWTLTANNTFAGITTVNAGTLLLTGSYASPTYTIASGAILELKRATSIDYAQTTAFFGAGTLRKTGAGTVQWNSVVATFAFSSGAVIDVQAGSLLANAGNNDVWTNNKARLTVAASAVFDCGTQSPVIIDELTGAGSVIVGTTAVSQKLTIGIDNGSGSFSGILSNYSATYIGRIEKLGSGTQTLSGANTYTGETVITVGELKLGASEVIPNLSAVTVNGTLNLNSFSETVGSITGSGYIDNKTGGGSPVFKFGIDNTTTALAGVLKNTTGTMNVTKTGTGKIYLDGNNTYYGQTYVEDGFVEIRNGSIMSN